MQFKKATKEQAKLRLAVFGPSGSGKTFTSLRLATGLGGNIAFIDTERGSASKYADRFAFDVLELPKKDIDTYCQAITAAKGYGILIIDSLTHAWHELLDEVEKLARSKYRGNTWSAWSEGTPKQRQLVDAILDFEGHVIATMRTKTEWTVTTNDRGKSAPVRVGLAPEQGKGIEYEFDLLMEITPDHIGTFIKDRTGKYQDQTISLPGEELGEELAAWLMDGTAPQKSQRKAPQAKAKAEAKADPPPPNPSGRPVPADELRTGMRKRAKWPNGTRVDSEPLTEKQEPTVVGLLSKAVKFDGMSQADLNKARYDVMGYLFNVRSTKALSKAEASAIIDWLSADGDVTQINEYAQAEAAGILQAAAVEAGQQELPL